MKNRVKLLLIIMLIVIVGLVLYKGFAPHNVAKRELEKVLRYAVTEEPINGASYPFVKDLNITKYKYQKSNLIKDEVFNNGFKDVRYREYEFLYLLNSQDIIGRFKVVGVDKNYRVIEANIDD